VNRGWLALLVAALVVSAVALTQAPRLHIAADLLELLPPADPASRDYRLLLERFGALDQVFVVVESRARVADPRETLADAACAVAEALEGSRWFSTARCGLTEADERFMLEAVLPRAALLVPPQRLEGVARRLTPDALRDRVREERSRIAGPLGVVEGELFAADPAGLADDLELAATSTGGPAVDPVYDAFVSGSGTRSLALATPSFAELDTGSGRDMVAFLDETFASIEADLGGSVALAALGGPIYAVHDERIVRGDVIRTATGSALAITLLLLLFFGRPRIPLVLFVVVAAGVVWTAALMAVLHGEITVIGISFAAILIGLGVDYGIHGSAAFEAARAMHARPAAAMRHTLATTGPAILASAATTAAAFLVLVTAAFGPVRELGLLVASGIVLTLLATLCVGAPLLVLLSRSGAAAEPPRPSPLWRWIAGAVDRVIDASARHRGAVLVMATVLTAVSVWGLSRLGFDANPRLMRPVDHPAARLERILSEDFALGLDAFTVVVQGADLGEALERADRAAGLLRANLGPGVAVLSPSDYLVAGSFLERRARDAAAAIDPRAVADLRAELLQNGFDPAAFEPSLAVLEQLAAGSRPPEVPRERWPDWLARLVDVGEDDVRVAVQATGRNGRWPDGPPPALVAELERELPGTAVASINRVGAGLRALVGHELRALSGFSLLTLGVVVLISFRFDLRRAALSLVPVVAGCVWLLGLCGLAGIRINLFSVVVAPMLLGIGIDDGLHALHGARVHSGLLRSLRSVGIAIAITTLTTCTGFGSLALSRLPALREGGVVIALGTLLCLLATLVLLPACARREPRGGPEPRLRERRNDAPHAPAVGRFARLLGPFQITGPFWYRLHLFGVRVVPSWAIGGLIRPFALLFAAFLPGIRRAIAANLAPVLGSAGRLESLRRAHRTMLQFAWSLTERYEWLAGKSRPQTEPVDVEVWQQATSSHRGVIVVTAHVGNWEIGSAIPASRERRRVHLVREEELDPRAQQFIEELLREQTDQLYTTHFASDDLRLGLLLRDALAAGEVVALQGDRPRAGGKTIEVSLFGRPFALPGGPFALGRLADVPLLPVFMFREGRLRYRLHFRPPIHVERSASKRRDLEAAAERLGAEIEWAIRTAPHQWYCFRSLWS